MGGGYRSDAGRGADAAGLFKAGLQEQIQPAASAAVDCGNWLPLSARQLAASRAPQASCQIGRASCRERVCLAV